VRALGVNEVNEVDDDLQIGDGLEVLPLQVEPTVVDPQVDVNTRSNQLV